MTPPSGKLRPRAHALADLSINYIILVVYDGRCDRTFWLHVQACFRDRPSADLFLVGQTPDSGFVHDESDAWIILPPYRSNALVPPHNLAQVRIMLDAKGLMDAEEFERLVAGIRTRHSASRGDR